MSSFEIASWVTWKSLPILPSIFGLPSQNIVSPHYPSHSVCTWNVLKIPNGMNYMKTKDAYWIVNSLQIKNAYAHDMHFSFHMVVISVIVSNSCQQNLIPLFYFYFA